MVRLIRSNAIALDSAIMSELDLKPIMVYSKERTAFWTEIVENPILAISFR